MGSVLDFVTLLEQVEFQCFLQANTTERGDIPVFFCYN
jgi:hypothetical protein